jgi:hypothetical protein
VTLAITAGEKLPFLEATEDGFLSNEFPNCASETIKARPFLERKDIFLFF